MPREPGPIRPYTTEVDFLPRWHLMDIDSDVDANDDTIERTLVLPIKNRGILVRVTTLDKMGAIASDALTFVQSACIEKQVGKKTGHVLGHVIGSGGANGSITAVKVNETPEYLQKVAEDERIAEEARSALEEAARLEAIKEEAAAKRRSEAATRSAATRKTSKSRTPTRPARKPKPPDRSH